MLLSVTTSRRAAGALRSSGAAAEDLTLAQALVVDHGWNSCSHLVFDSGMRRWYSAAGDALVAYVEVAGYRVVAGAPVASDERLVSVAREFELTSRRAGRRVSYFGAEERFVSAVGGRCTRHMIGHQPVWRAGSWARRFEADRTLRAQRNRAANKGVAVTERPARAEEERPLKACHAAWLSSKRMPRMGFIAHAGSDPGRPQGRRLFVAGQPGRQVVAYLTASPVPRRRGWLIDKVVRRPDAPNGTTELLIDAAARALTRGSERLTLGLAPLSSAFRSQTDGSPQTEDAIPRWLRHLEKLALTRGKRFYDFEGLYAFKGKFGPDAWEPVYLLSTEPHLGLGAVLAVLGAFFLT